MPCLGRLRKFPRNWFIIQKSDRLFNVFPGAFGLETIMTTGFKAVIGVARIAYISISGLVSRQSGRKFQF
jgi:hypothetical protein